MRTKPNDPRWNLTGQDIVEAMQAMEGDIDITPAEPVVDAASQLVGIFSRADLIRATHMEETACPISRK